MSEPQPDEQQPVEQQPEKKQPAALAYFPVGIALMASGLSLTITLGWAGFALIFSGLTFVILSIPALKAHLAQRRDAGRP